MILLQALSKIVRTFHYHSGPLNSNLIPVTSLRKIKEKKGSTTRKLVGHSGPVYSLAFDPLNGSASPPRYLLSASADATARLWSMETMSNVVAFRGHENPIWDVKWSPIGVYFATASRDRTARLWSNRSYKLFAHLCGTLKRCGCTCYA